MYGQYTVYCHTLRLDGRKYFGITKQRPRKRWSYGAGYENTTYFGRAIRKYGWGAFDHEIIATGLSEEKAKEMERDLISKYKTNDRANGFNLTDGGDGVSGYKASPETILKLRLSHIGKKQSEETKRRQSESHKEYYKTHECPKRSEESRRKNAEAHIGRPGYFKGKHLSDATKEKLRLANIGKKHTDETKAKMRESSPKKKQVQMFDLDGNYIRSFSSTQEAARELGLKWSGSIGRCCLGRLKTAYNYKWKYYEQ